MADDTIRRQAAIEAVLKESNMDGAYGYMDAKDIVDLLNKQPSAQSDLQPICNKLATDCISRQAAIKAIEDLQDCYNGFSDTYDKACIIGILEEIPTAQTDQQECEKCIFKPFKQFQPERKKGKWIIVTDSRGRHAECPYCGEWKYHPQQKFCGECGAQMEVEE